jgi:sugar (pentulose or hexulose) kinase
MALLNLSLVSQTRVALYRAGLTNGARVFTEGGFRKNEDYIRLLAAALPDNPVYVTDIAEASLFGCALTTVAALTGATPTYLADRFEVDYRRVEPLGSLEGFESYYSSFLLRTHGDRDPIFKQEGKQP